jgi:hypothetical protein
VKGKADGSVAVQLGGVAMNAALFRVLRIMMARFERVLPGEYRTRAERKCGVYDELIVCGPGLPFVAAGEIPPVGRVELDIVTSLSEPFELELLSWIEVDGRKIGETFRHGPFDSFATLDTYLNRPRET